MKQSINWIIEYFSKNSTEFVDIFKSYLPPNSKDYNRKTAKGLCGIVVAVRGKCLFSVNNNNYNLNENTILHCGSSLDLRIETKDVGIEYYVVHYKNILIEEKFKHIENDSFSFEIGDRVSLLKYCENILYKGSRPDDYSKFYCKVDFMNLINSLIISIRTSQYSDELKVVHKAIEYINENYNKPISVSEISYLLAVDRRQFSDVFQAVVGLSPNKYIQKYRLEEAKSLLKFSTYSISEIADMTGYNDCFYFSKSFKKNIGVSPKEYRKNNKLISIL